jgi:hypoxanthine phosphoribosyltransferase
LNHAFAVEPLLADTLRGKRVVLVDDVMTTGASLYTVARVLKAAGVSQVTGLVVARTEWCVGQACWRGTVQLGVDGNNRELSSVCFRG